MRAPSPRPHRCTAAAQRAAETKRAPSEAAAQCGRAERGGKRAKDAGRERGTAEVGEAERHGRAACDRTHAPARERRDLVRRADVQPAGSVHSQSPVPARPRTPVPRSTRRPPPIVPRPPSPQSDHVVRCGSEARVRCRSWLAPPQTYRPRRTRVRAVLAYSGVLGTHSFDPQP
jgi:hypothetical protein